jgi:hypothetical protein
MAEKLRSRNPPDIAAPGIRVINAFIILSLVALVIIAIKGREEKKKGEKGKSFEKREKSFVIEVGELFRGGDFGERTR